MKKLLNALKSDILFQFRHGFYYVYLAISLLYLIVFFQLPKNILKYVVPATIFSDPSLLGLFFIGAIFLLEKEQGIFTYISITPLSLAKYILSKIISLSILSMCVAFIMAIIIGIKFDPLLLFFGCLLSSCFFSLLGLYAVSSANSMNQFFYIIIPYVIIMMLPILAFFNIPYVGFLKIFPTYTGLKLVLGAYNGMVFLDIIYCILDLVLFCFIAFCLTMNKISKKIYGR